MRKSYKLQLAILFLVVVLYACNQSTTIDWGQIPVMDVPTGFPSIPQPSDNQYTIGRWTFGKQLFYDKALSRDSSVSCASCHSPENAFGDDVAKSLGAGMKTGRSNAPPLFNLAYHPYFTRAGGVFTLETQILVPVQEHDEFDMNFVELAERLKANPNYQKMAIDHYQRELDPYVITRAIANFERSLISGYSPYDAFQQGDKNHGMSLSAQRGMNLFFSERVNCNKCHQGFNFTDYSFKNNGLYIQYADSGRMRLTHQESDRALFKVPSLRNVGYTAPYMHDGSMKTLEEVIAHYNAGGKAHSNKSEVIQPLNLSDTEQKDLIAFLNSLNDLRFVNNRNLKQ